MTNPISPYQISRYPNLYYLQTPVGHHNTIVQFPTHLEIKRSPQGHLFLVPSFQVIRPTLPTTEQLQSRIATPPKPPNERSAPGKMSISSLIHPEDLEPKMPYGLSWTPEMDQRLLKLWKKSKPWKQIAADLHRKEGICKNRWQKNIKPELPEYQKFRELYESEMTRFRPDHYISIHREYFKKT